MASLGESYPERQVARGSQSKTPSCWWLWSSCSQPSTPPCRPAWLRWVWNVIGTGGSSATRRLHEDTDEGSIAEDEDEHTARAGINKSDLERRGNAKVCDLRLRDAVEAFPDSQEQEAVDP